MLQELEEAQTEVESKMDRKLTMPPVMEERKDNTQVAMLSYFPFSIPLSFT